MPLVPSLSERLGSSRNVGLVWRFVNEHVSSMAISRSATGDPLGPKPPNPAGVDETRFRQRRPGEVCHRAGTPELTTGQIGSMSLSSPVSCSHRVRQADLCRPTQPRQ